MMMIGAGASLLIAKSRTTKVDAPYYNMIADYHGVFMKRKKYLTNTLGAHAGTKAARGGSQL